MEKKKNLILIDGHALAFRQYYALERTNMRNSSGVPTWAVYGFFKAIFDLMKNKDLEPDAIAVTFDVSHQTFRTAEYAEYKANRVKMPDDMQVQMGLIYEGLEAFSIPVYKKEGFEADDVIGTISKRACELGHNVYILTGDQDAFQLVDKEGFVKVVIPSKGELIEYTWDKVYEKLGVYPEQVIDYKALRGDTSDNIPGIKGIGEKTAQKLLARFGDLDNIFENVGEIKENSVREKISSGREIAYLSKYLATIVRDVDIDFDFDKACLNMPSLSVATAFLTKLQLFSFLKNINNILNLFDRGDGNCNPASSSLVVSEDVIVADKVIPTQENIVEKLVDSSAIFEEMVNNIKRAGAFFFLTSGDLDSVVTQNIDTIAIGIPEIKFENNIFSINLNSKNKAVVYCVPFSFLRTNDCSRFEQLKFFLENENFLKFTYDCKKEYNSLRCVDIQLNNVAFDVVLASYLDNPSNNHELDVQALQYLNITPVNSSTGNAGVVQLGLLGSVVDNSKIYRDMWLLIELSRYHIANFSAEKWNLLRNFELPLACVLADMEFNGVAIDTVKLTDFTNYLNCKIKDLETAIYGLAGEVFNLNSPKQVGEVFFEKLGMPHKKRKNAKSNYSTSADVLEKLAEDYEIAKLLLKYRQYAKLKSTYTDALPLLVNKKDNRIHTTYNQTLTVTGRLSSSNPNLQNIPARTEEGEKIRQAFVAKNDDYCILSADYSQIELRLLAHISGDSVLRRAFVDNVDVHSVTASKIFQVPLEEVTKQMRSRAKAVNFGIIYGQTKYGLAKAVGISNDEAEDFINRYFATYPDIKNYMNEMILKVERDMWAETIFGRRRYFENEINSSNAMIREFAKRAAINFPMQGSAADLMKLAMVKFYFALKENNLKSKMIMQVHDEIVVEVAKDELERVKSLVVDAMELGQPLTVPLVVDVEIGAHW